MAMSKYYVAQISDQVPCLHHQSTAKLRKYEPQQEYKKISWPLSDRQLCYIKSSQRKNFCGKFLLINSMTKLQLSRNQPQLKFRIASLK